MTRRAMVAAAMLLALAGMAWAQAPKPPPAPAPKPAPRYPWVPTFEDVLAASEKSDSPIIVYVYLTNNPACLALEDSLLRDSTFRKLSQLFLLARVEGTKRPDVVEKYQVKAYPTLLFLDSAGEKIAALDANLTPKRVLSQMGKSFLISMFNAGKRQAAAGHARAAIRRFRMVQIIGEGTPPAKWSEKEIDALLALGVKKFSQAQIALDAGDVVKCVTLLDELVYEWRGTPSGLDAQKLYDKLSEEPRGQEAIREMTRRQLGARLLALAKKQDGKQDLESALITYWDVSRDYPKTPAADEAAARAAEIAKDADLAARAKEKRQKRDCENWIEMAQAFQQNRLTDKAVEYYRRVLDNYPGTPYALKVRAALDVLGAAPKK